MALFRIQPGLPAQAYKSYVISTPLSSHWREARCEEVECDAFLYGWVTTVDLGSELGQQQAYYIARESYRKFTSEHHGDVIEFTFEPGQQCFTSHRIRVESTPHRFIVRGGDWRLNTGLIREHRGFDDWADDFANHQDQIKTLIERG